MEKRTLREVDGNGCSNDLPTVVTGRPKLPLKLHRIISSIDVEGDAVAPGGEETQGIPTSPRPPLPDTLKDRVQDVVTITSLSLKLLRYLYSGVRWYFKFLRLLLFTILLLPGFAQMILFYYFSPRVLRSIPYGSMPRNRLDVYLPRRKWRKNGPCPVCIYVTGGAWIIGYKAWGALFGRRLSQRGILVFCLDYRNFPQGTAPDMLTDINSGIAWCMANSALYGGNDEFFLVGQSAGGHLTTLALLAQAEQAANCISIPGAHPSWNPQAIKGCTVISGAFNLETLMEHMHQRGLYRGLMRAIMSGPDGQPMLRDLSPTHVVQERLSRAGVKKVPELLVLHGSADNSVPLENAAEFTDALKDKGIRASLKVFKGKTHTQPIVEDPMRGGRDELMDVVLSFMTGKEDCYNLQFPMLPAMLIDAATAVCPF